MYFYINLSLQITEQIHRLQKEKLQSYRIEIAKDARKAEILTSQFEASIYIPAMVDLIFILTNITT